MNEEHMTFSEGFRFVILLINFIILAGLLLLSFAIITIKVVGLLTTLPLSIVGIVLWIMVIISLLVGLALDILVIGTLGTAILDLRGKVE